MKELRIVVISHALIQEPSRARWRLLAERYPAQVTLLVPARWESMWSGSLVSWDPKPVHEGRFQVLPLPVTNSREGVGYLFRSVDARLHQLRPDVIFVMQEESSLVLQQMIAYRRLWAPRAKLAFFSWNNLRIPLHNGRPSRRWRAVRSHTDMAVAGNSEVKQVLRNGGYARPIWVQTEIGIDEQVFKPDAEARRRLRAELGLRGFVFGYAGQVRREKGVLDLALALKELAGDWQWLIVGDGPELRAVQDLFADRPERLCAVGYVPIDKVPDYIRLPDVLVLPSQTHLDIRFKEQFGLVLAQAMASQVPVVGSSSGAIPEVIGDAGLIFPEGDAPALRRCLETLMLDSPLRAHLARRGVERATARYSSSALADGSYHMFRGLADNCQPAEAS